MISTLILITLLVILTILVAVVGIVAVAFIGTGGAVFIILFADIIACVWIVVKLVKLIRNRKRKRKGL